MVVMVEVMIVNGIDVGANGDDKIVSVVVTVGVNVKTL